MLAVAKNDCVKEECSTILPDRLPLLLILLAWDGWRLQLQIMSDSKNLAVGPDRVNYLGEKCNEKLCKLG